MFKYQLVLLSLCFLSTTVLFGQNPENWTSNQLKQPADLAAQIKSGKNLPVILSVGPGAIIPGSTNIGMTKDADKVALLKKTLSTLPKNKEVVIYCGCCPFDKCPNVRPAITALKEMKFTNYYLLNLPKNIRADWISKGYPSN